MCGSALLCLSKKERKTKLLQSDIKKQLLSLYKYRIEMHAHTSPASPCSQIPPEKMVRIYSGLGYDAVVITNHFIFELLNKLPKKEAVKAYLEDYQKAVRESEKYNIKILLGAEIRFTENINDYLLYGVDENILNMVYDYLPRGIKAFRNELKLDKSVFIQAHPFRDGMKRVDPALLDGIETFNLHPGHNSRVAIAQRYASTNNFKITTAGSDFHHPDRGHEGISALRTKKLPGDSFELAEILKSGDYIFEIGASAVVLP